jgi:DNA-binding transcriptional ArsR family regulator
MKPFSAIDETRVAKALSHPLRAQILGILEQRRASPNRLAEELGEPLGNVAYHVRTLLDMKLIKLVDTAPRRGATEHYYEAVAQSVRISDKAWAATPRVAKRSVARSALQEIGRSTGAAAAEGGFDRPDAHLTRTMLTLDERGWKELAKELARLLKRAEQLQKESQQRLRKAERSGEVRAGLALLLYEAAEAAEKPRGKGKAKRRAASPRRRASK